MEKLVDTSKTIHDKIVKTMIKSLKNVEIKKVIDAGSGKTSASILLKYFPNALVDAVVYPGDNRKKNPLENAIGSNRLEIVEADMCKTCIRKKYDFCLAHLILGEAHNFGNHFSDLFHQVMDLKSKYYLIVDILEDPAVHFRYVEQYLKEKDFKILKKKKFRNPNPEHYPKSKYDKYKLEFDSKHFLAYLVARNEN
ncbi:MAG: hypothetical protein E7351_00065 [Clostridiales bacterium]|nr:hypothetical protein [Clostridiales bacterium]